jgi:uncharacterized paraquat-inducible protein A
MWNCPNCGKSIQKTAATCPHCGVDIATAIANYRPKAMPAGAILMLLLACGAAFLGLVLSSQATLGPAVVGIACLLGIIARIMQAQAHQRK